MKIPKLGSSPKIVFLLALKIRNKKKTLNILFFYDINYQILTVHKSTAERKKEPGINPVVEMRSLARGERRVRSAVWWSD